MAKKSLSLSSITPAIIKAHNLTGAEYLRIKKILNREPNITELGIFSVQWSEHCSYKSSKVYLKLFPTDGKGVLVKAGEENAGIVDIGDGLGIAFKIESHNHPSAVEPHAGAATGVGGIIRDIFTMGARPIALLDSLRFGLLSHKRSRFLLNGVVKGIADYGNCVGIPTVGGEVYFDDVYKENPLVNVMCIGLIDTGKIARARAKGIGNSVLYVGSSTGRDGLGGASFASRELTEESEEDRPAVQLGDPFAEKCLLEATLKALATGYVVGIQDMGAAGLTCSTCETASRGNVGIEIDISRVPKRETGLTPYEVMLSESQERMLLIVKKGKESRIKRIFDKWDLNCVKIGQVTDGGIMRVRENGKIVAEIPVKALTDDAPVYRRKIRKPKPGTRLQKPEYYGTKDCNKILKHLLASPTIASKEWIYRQYDHMVQTNTVVMPGLDAAVLRIKGTDKLLAATVDGNGRYCEINPYEGGKIAVCEAARNLACSGARPLAVTDCLNFGNPEDPEVMWQFKECVRGIADACRILGTPVTGGNVSFYNESPDGAIYPTPVIGMIGIMRNAEFGMWNVKLPVTSYFKDEGDIIILLGEDITFHNLHSTICIPTVDLRKEKALHKTVLQAINKGIVKSAHDCSEGGLGACLAECCIMNEEKMVGANCKDSRWRMMDGREWKNLRSIIHYPLSILFGERQSRIVVTCESKSLKVVERIAESNNIPLLILGEVSNDRLQIAEWIDLEVAELNRIWRGSIPHLMRG